METQTDKKNHRQPSKNQIQTNGRYLEYSMMMTRKKRNIAIEIADKQRKTRHCTITYKERQTTRDADKSERQIE